MSLTIRRSENPGSNVRGTIVLAIALYVRHREATTFVGHSRHSLIAVHQGIINKLPKLPSAFPFQFPKT